MNFEFINLEIKDVILIKPNKLEDNRGWFMESYKKSIFKANGIDCEFVQDNYSKSDFKVLRGLHFQKNQHAQAKLIRCIKGEILDVAVDLRKNSKTYGKYIKQKLSDKNNHILFIPKDFAHGFVTLSKTAEVYYKTSNEYQENSQGGIIWNDEDLNIDWEIDFEPILSNKDKNLPKFKDI